MAATDHPVTTCSCGAYVVVERSDTVASIDPRFHALVTCGTCDRQMIDHRMDIAPPGFLDAVEAYHRAYYSETVEQKGAEFIEAARYRLDSAPNVVAKALFKDVVGNLGSPRILDFGCGAGTAARFLAQEGIGVKEYVGLDISDAYLKAADRDYPFPAKLRRLSSFDLEANGYDFGAEADVFLALMVFSHLPHRHVLGIIKRLAEMRVGHLVLQDFIPEKGTSAGRFLMLNETFPLFVHDLLTILEQHSFAVRRIERTLPLYGGANWRVLHAVRT